jgi:hypothetical protein
MKQSISTKELTLLAGILVALIVAFMSASTTSIFSAAIPAVPVSGFDLPAVTKVTTQKIALFF